MIKNLYRSSCKVHVVLSDFPETWNFVDRFSKCIQITDSMKVRPVGAELLHADGLTDRQTDTDTWRSYCSFYAVLRTRLKSEGVVEELGNNRFWFRDLYLITYLLTYSMEQIPSPEANRFAANQEYSPHFMEPEDSLSHLQAHATCPYPEPALSSPYPHIPLPEDPS